MSIQISRWVPSSGKNQPALSVGPGFRWHMTKVPLVPLMTSWHWLPKMEKAFVVPEM